MRSTSMNQIQTIDGRTNDQSRSREDQTRPENDVARIGGIREQGGTASRTASRTATLTINNEQNNEAGSPEILPLTLRGRPSVTWDENVIDNEGMGKKSSKRCCIFHKQRAYDESSTDTSDYDSDGSLSSDSGVDDKQRKHGKVPPRKIAHPKQGKKVPDYQRFHA